MTVTSARFLPSGKGFRRRKSGPYAIRICHLLCPVPHGEGRPVPDPPEIVIMESEKEEDDEICDISEQSTAKYHEFARNVMSAEPHRIT